MTRTNKVVLLVCVTAALVFIAWPIGARETSVKDTRVKDANKETTVVKIPAHQSLLDTRFIYIVDLLHKALVNTEVSHGKFQLMEIDKELSETRGLKELEDNGGLLNVLWSSTSIDKETRLRAIRVPLLKGMLGYRLLLTTSEHLPKLAEVRTLEHLRDFIVGQGHAWGDVQVYRHNKVDVATSPQYESLFKMLLQRRFDIFPRGLTEIFAEYHARQHFLPGLTIEPNLYLYYPWPYYLFTAKQDEALASRIETGLESMIASGEFDRIFHQHFESSLNSAKLGERRGIHLTNPLLPEDTPLSRPELWYSPNK